MCLTLLQVTRSYKAAMAFRTKRSDNMLINSFRNHGENRQKEKAETKKEQVKKVTTKL